MDEIEILRQEVCGIDQEQAANREPSDRLDDSLSFDAPSVFENWLGSMSGSPGPAHPDHADVPENELSGFFGSEMVMKCEASFHGTLRVDGYLAGKVTSEDGTLIVSRDGRVDATVEVAVAIIDGELNGDVTAIDRIELGSEARVVGNLASASLSIERGAILEGNCHFRQPRKPHVEDTELAAIAAMSAVSGL